VRVVLALPQPVVRSDPDKPSKTNSSPKPDAVTIKSDSDGDSDVESIDGNVVQVAATSVWTKKSIKKASAFVAQVRAAPDSTTHDPSNRRKLAGLLKEICGVISETSGKMCGLNQNCGVHTHHQRVELRQNLGCSTVDIEEKSPKNMSIVGE